MMQSSPAPLNAAVSTAPNSGEGVMDAELVSVESVTVEMPVVATAVDEGIADRYTDKPIAAVVVDVRSFLRRVWDATSSAAEWMFGLASLLVALAVLAPLPVLQFLSLGYLLEASGRIARTGRLRAGFVGVRKAARVGSLVFGAWVMLLPLRFVSTMAARARLIEPGSPADRNWSLALWILTVLLVGHILGACLRGGKLRHFLWPRPIKLLKQLFVPNAYATARDHVWDFATGLHLPHLFWLGARGFAGGLIWLAIPVSLLASARFAPVLGFVGGVLLAIVLLYVPFLQTRMAAENRFRAMFEVGQVRQAFRRGPFAFWVALLMTLALALPLYLLKIEVVPRDAAWLPALVFVVFTLPARLACGWAYGYADHREKPRNWFLRQGVRLTMLPVTGFYVFLVFFTQYTSTHGVWSLYAQHAFLLPVPFLGL
jgi:hypothetical protein